MFTPTNTENRSPSASARSSDLRSSDLHAAIASPGSRFRGIHQWRRWTAALCAWIMLSQARKDANRRYRLTTWTPAPCHRGRTLHLNIADVVRARPASAPGTAAPDGCRGTAIFMRQWAGFFPVLQAGAVGNGPALKRARYLWLRRIESVVSFFQASGQVPDRPAD